MGAEVEQHPSELQCWQGTGHAMPSAHRHDDLEVNVVDGAPLTYLFSGTLFEIQPGQAAVFWAALPHRLIDCAHNWQARVRWLHVPLGHVQRWTLQAGTLATLLGGTPLVSTDVAYPTSADFARWSDDIATGVTDRADIALLEIQAGVRRLLERAAPPTAPQGADRSVEHVAAMARFIAESFRDPITVPDVAAAAHLHPKYAMTVFRQVLGVTVHAYISQQRVAEAQRLLLTTRATIGQVAQGAGFGSQSAFYDTFTRACGVSPGEYRRTNAAATSE